MNEHDYQCLDMNPTSLDEEDHMLCVEDESEVTKPTWEIYNNSLTVYLHRRATQETTNLMCLL